MTDQFQSVDEFRAQRESKFFFPAIYVFVLALVISSFIYGRSNVDHRVTVKIAEKSEQSKTEVVAEPIETTASVDPVKSDIQVVLILDTSSSMDGLLSQARTQIWEIVNSLQEDENGKLKSVAVALYRYGSDRVPEENGYIECLVPLSLEHQNIVDALEWIRAGGEKEYAAQAILAALEEQPWDLSTTIPKVVIIVGNENFFQGDTKFEEVMEVAQEKKIRILPVYCIGETASKSGLASWRRAAALAQAELLVIDPNQTVTQLETPIDKEILAKLAELERLNKPFNQVEAPKPENLDELLVRARREGWSRSNVPQSPKAREIEGELQILSSKRAQMYGKAEDRGDNLGYSVSKGMKSVLRTY